MKGTAVEMPHDKAAVLRDGNYRNLCIDCAPKESTVVQARVRSLFNIVIPVSCMVSILATALIVDRKSLTLESILLLLGLIVFAGISHVIFLAISPAGGSKVTTRHLSELSFCDGCHRSLI